MGRIIRAARVAKRQNVFVEEKHPAPSSRYSGVTIRIEQFQRDPISNRSQPLGYLYLYEILLSLDGSGTREREREKVKERRREKEERKRERERARKRELVAVMIASRRRLKFVEVAGCRAEAHAPLRRTPAAAARGSDAAADPGVSHS